MRNKIIISGIILASIIVAASHHKGGCEEESAVALVGGSTAAIDDSLTYYYVQARNNKTVSQSALQGPKSLADIIEYYPSSWITEYDSVVISATCNGRQQIARSNNASLSKRQREILKTADIFTDVGIFVKHKTTNSVTKKKENESITYKLYVRPETQAKYPGGKDALQQYLKDDTKEQVAKLETKMGFLAIVYFTIDKEGKPVDIEISESSEYKGVDDILLKTLKGMPKWAPALDAKGNKVPEKFEFAFGFGREGGGC